MLTLEQRYRIIFLHLDKYGPSFGYTKISSLMSIDIKTVKYWIQRYKKDPNLITIPSPGRKRKTEETEDEKIIKLALFKNRPSTRSISAKMTTANSSISHTTVSHRLREFGLKFLKPLSKPLLSEDNRRKRLQWAEDHIYFDWNTCIFTDEATFHLYQNTGSFWQHPSERKVCRTVKHPGKVHV